MAAPAWCSNRRAGRALVLRNLGKRPVLAQVEVYDLALVVGQQRPVTLKQGQGPATRLKGVKGHTLTAYQARINEIWTHC